MAVTEADPDQPGPFGKGRTFEAVVESPSKGTVKVDGHDLAAVIRGFDFSTHVGEFPRVVLDLAVHDGTRIAAQNVEVVMTARTHELLVAAGWTPPTLAGPASEQQ
ncbi:hypothetical protein [Actinoplanes sp. NPDC049316]|uniref:hypothetical protein n=1 Tax=Actinoplanes sp. NPDC049316 TaxID=3154727 RepID=UPI003448159B